MGIDMTCWSQDMAPGVEEPKKKKKKKNEGGGGIRNDLLTHKS